MLAMSLLTMHARRQEKNAAPQTAAGANGQRGSWLEQNLH